MKSKLFLSLLLAISLFPIFPTRISAQEARCAPKGTPLCLLRKDCPSDSDRASQCCDTLEQCGEPIEQVRCATSGSPLCVLRVNCPGDSNYSGYCCDNINQCYNTTAKGPESAPGPFCGNDNKGINTALGCISYEAEGGGFVKSLLSIIIGLGGGVALLLILYGVFIVTTSAGIPDKLNQGKEIISSAVAGLVFIILAIFLMNLIGIRILALPGLE